MSDKPSFSQVVRFCLSYKILPFIPFLTYIILPASIQQMFVLGQDSPHPFYLFDICLFVFFIIGVGKKQYNRQAPNLSIWIFFYFLMAFFAAIVNDISNLSLGFHYHLDFLLYAFLFRYAIYDKKEVSIVLLICKILIVYLSIQVILIFFGFISFDSSGSSNMLRGSSTAGSPNATGHTIYLLLVMSQFVTEKRIIRLALFLVSGIAIFFTLCRGAILAFGLFVMSVFLLHELHTTIIKKITYAFLLVGSLISLNSYFHFTDILEARQEESLAYSGGDYTAGRFVRWQAVFNTLDRDNAYIWGEGLVTTPMNRGEILSEKSVERDMRKSFSPHNVYIGVLAETGALSLVIFMVMLIYTARRFFRVDRCVFLGIIIFYGVSYMTEVTTYTQNYAVLIWFAYYNFRKWESPSLNSNDRRIIQWTI